MLLATLTGLLTLPFPAALVTKGLPDLSVAHTLPVERTVATGENLDVVAWVVNRGDKDALDVAVRIASRSGWSQTVVLASVPAGKGARGLAALLGEEGGALLESVGEVAAVSGPGHALGLDGPAVGAVSSEDAVAQVQRHARKVVVSPSPLAAVVDRAALRAALPATWDRPGRDHVRNEARGVEMEPANREVLDAEEDSEYRGRAQGGAWAEDVDTRSLVSPPRASTSTAETDDFGLQSSDPGNLSLTPLPLKV